MKKYEPSDVHVALQGVVVGAMVPICLEGHPVSARRQAKSGTPPMKLHNTPYEQHVLHWGFLPSHFGNSISKQHMFCTKSCIEHTLTFLSLQFRHPSRDRCDGLVGIFSHQARLQSLLSLHSGDMEVSDAAREGDDLKARRSAPPLARFGKRHSTLTTTRISRSLIGCWS